MSLYKQWTDTVIDFVKTHGENAFWRKYGSIEQNIYSKLLANHSGKVEGTIANLAKDFETDTVFFMGFLDGINESLNNTLDLENMDENAEIKLDINFEKLFFNMLDARADYLYSLPQWEGIFSIDKRKEIAREWRSSKIVINTNKVGRNEPCPCGSGKKYKNCCGK